MVLPLIYDACMEALHYGAQIFTLHFRQLFEGASQASKAMTGITATPLYTPFLGSLGNSFGKAHNH